VTITYFDDGEKRIILTGLFDFFDISAKELERRATLRFGLPRKLAPLLARSDRWGRIKAEIICSMTSRYGISLYEAVRLRANMDRCLEVFQIDRFREMIGVPPGAYENGTNFMNKVVTPALLEVNGLSDMGVAVQLNRRHARAQIDSVTVTWWRKGPEELTEVLAERNRSKLGRMERLKVTQQLETPRAVTTA
jgi:plasmid replication initiation protein